MAEENVSGVWEEGDLVQIVARHKPYWHTTTPQPRDLAEENVRAIIALASIARVHGGAHSLSSAITSTTKALRSMDEMCDQEETATSIQELLQSFLLLTIGAERRVVALLGLQGARCIRLLAAEYGKARTVEEGWRRVRKLLAQHAPKTLPMSVRTVCGL